MAQISRAMKITKSFQAVLYTSAAIVIVPFGTCAEEVYYRVPVESLKFTDGAPPPPTLTWSPRNWELLPVMQPIVVLDGNAGEAYVTSRNETPWNPISRFDENSTVFIRATTTGEIAGRLFLARTNLDGMDGYRFTLAPGTSTPNARTAFFKAKQSYYQRLQDRNIAGAAWFRHEAFEAGRQLGETNSRPSRPRTPPRSQVSQLEDTYDLLTGGRALSENLQLDRVLAAAQSGEDSVALTNLTGITIREMNWKELLTGAKPELDPLAAFIPADQHAVFFRSFEAMIRTLDEADANGTPVLQWLDPRSEDSLTRRRYETQLCLGLSQVSRILGPQVIASIAFTGSDPFLRTGSDVGVFFETRNPDLLKGYLAAQYKGVLAGNPAARAVRGNLEGLAYTGIVTPDRSVCSYVASISNIVLVCNSKVQIENAARAAHHDIPALTSQEEYLFFRTRYPRSDTSETALAVLTDAAIRRWCGPKWRILDSRRTRAAAVMSDLQAAHMQEIMSGKAANLPVNSPYPVPGEPDDLRLTANGVVSPMYGSLAFMTPIAEIPLDKVSHAEADAYVRWRDRYQNNWRQYFDPAALRLSLTAGRIGADLTVTPLIVGSDYRQLIDLSSGAEITADSGDRHSNALVHLVFAINAESRTVQEAGNFVGNMAPGLKANPFGWLGKSIAVYADDDPFWSRLQNSTKADEYFEQHFSEVPIALHFEVKSPLGLAGFLTALHAYVDQTAPRMTTWQNLDYNNQPFVKITARNPEMNSTNEFAVYYAATPKSLVVTLSEPILKRALDRQAARAAAAPDPNSFAALNPWLGKSLCAALQAPFISIIQAVNRDTYETRLQVIAWSNLPILNEWKRLYPDKNPVDVHERIWGTRLICPGGGQYVWNEKWQTMESSVFGHPGEPRTASPVMLKHVHSAQLGVTFENQGLTAHGLLDRTAD